MKSKMCFLVMASVIIFIQNKAEAQLKIVIDSVKIGNIINVRPSNYYMENFYSGPALSTYCSFINESNTDTVFLFPSKAKIEILYNYQNKEYHYKFLCASLQDEYFFSCPIVFLKPLERKEYFASLDYYLLGTDFFKDKRRKGNDTIVDCTREVIETLPTLRIQYSDGTNEAVSDRIRKVIVNGFPVYYGKPKH